MLAIPAFETDAGLNAGLPNGSLHLQGVLEGEADGLLDDEVLAGPGGVDSLPGMLRVGGADVDRVNVRIGQHCLVAGEGSKRGAVVPAQGGFIELPPRADSRDPGSGNCFEGIDVSAGHPAQTHNAHSHIAHLLSLLFRRTTPG